MQVIEFAGKVPHFAAQGCTERGVSISIPNDRIGWPPTPSPEQLILGFNHKSPLVRWAVADVIEKSEMTGIASKIRPKILEILTNRNDGGFAAAEFVLRYSGPPTQLLRSRLMQQMRWQPRMRL